jgi:hypothetical protein
MLSPTKEVQNNFQGKAVKILNELPAKVPAGEIVQFKSNNNSNSKLY